MTEHVDRTGQPQYTFHESVKKLEGKDTSGHKVVVKSGEDGASIVKVVTTWEKRLMTLSSIKSGNLSLKDAIAGKREWTTAKGAQLSSIATSAPDGPGKAIAFKKAFNDPKFDSVQVTRASSEVRDQILTFPKGSDGEFLLSKLTPKQLTGTELTAEELEEAKTDPKKMLIDFQKTRAIRDFGVNFESGMITDPQKLTTALQEHFPDVADQLIESKVTELTLSRAIAATGMSDEVVSLSDLFSSIEEHQQIHQAALREHLPEEGYNADTLEGELDVILAKRSGISDNTSVGFQQPFPDHIDVSSLSEQTGSTLEEDLKHFQGADALKKELNNPNLEKIDVRNASSELRDEILTFPKGSDGEFLLAKLTPDQLLGKKLTENELKQLGTERNKNVMDHLKIKTIRDFGIDFESGMITNPKKLTTALQNHFPDVTHQFIKDKVESLSSSQSVHLSDLFSSIENTATLTEMIDELRSGRTIGDESGFKAKDITIASKELDRIKASNIDNEIDFSDSDSTESPSTEKSALTTENEPNMENLEIYVDFDSELDDLDNISKNPEKE